MATGGLVQNNPASRPKMNLDYKDFLEHAIAVALEAGQVLLKGQAELQALRRRGVGGVRLKGPSDLVTEYDVQSETLCRRLLLAKYPDHGFVGEEGSRDAGELTWCVDPIDGTSNFAHGHPFFCVSIALLREGQPIVGVIHAPALGRTYAAAKNSGATLNGSPISVSATSSLDEALLATGFPADRRRTTSNNYLTFAAVDSKSHGARRCGAAALELALVAEGAYDGFWERALHSWDIAAGSILVTEAGGQISSFGTNDDPLTSGQVLATNGLLHAALREGIEGTPDLPPMDLKQLKSPLSSGKSELVQP